MIGWLRSLFAWRTIYENHAWLLRGNDLTGARRWQRKISGGYSPRPLIDDEGRVIPLGPPPSRPTR